MTANWMIAAGGLLFFILGALHLRMTVADLKAPKIFAPAKPGLLDELQNTRMNFRKDLKSFWRTYMGFHVSHSVGLLFYGSAVIYCALARPDIFADYIARIGVVAFGASYALMSRSFFFIIPLVGTLIGVTLIAVGMAMLYS